MIFSNTVLCLNNDLSIGNNIKDAAFQVVSIMTTTGYATTDFNLWPEFSKGIMVCLMFIGACAGSTGGGLKVGRIIILFNRKNKLRRTNVAFNIF